MTGVTGGCLLRYLDEGDVHGVGAGFLVGGDVLADDHREGLDSGGVFQPCGPVGGAGDVSVADGGPGQRL